MKLSRIISTPPYTIRAYVNERLTIESKRELCNICERQVKSHDDKSGREIEPWQRLGVGQYQLKKSEDCIERVHRDVIEPFIKELSAFTEAYPKFEDIRLIAVLIAAGPEIMPQYTIVTMNAMSRESAHTRS